MPGIRQDAVLAVRQMRRSPGFATTAVITLALGIAANVIVFGVLRVMILESVPIMSVAEDETPRTRRAPRVLS